MHPQQHHCISENNSFPEFPDQETQIILLRPGFELIIGDYHVARRVKVTFDSRENVCEFVFVLSGKIRSWIYGFRKDMEVTPLFAALWLTPRLESYTDYLPGQDVRFACIRVNRLLLAELAGEYLRQVPDDFRLVLEGRQESLYYRFSTMTIPMQAAAQQVFNCPYQGGMKKLFLESKALELISHLMAYHFGGAVDKDDSLPGSDLKQIKLARDILLEHMEAPLSLPELAGYAGINETKLKRGFRKVYGTSVFGYLRNQRLDKARILLETGDMNVSEVAYSVGYSSPGHFTLAFTKHCGINPKDYLRGFRNFT